MFGKSIRIVSNRSRDSIKFISVKKDMLMNETRLAYSGKHNK